MRNTHNMRVYVHGLVQTRTRSHAHAIAHSLHKLTYTLVQILYARVTHDRNRLRAIRNTSVRVQNNIVIVQLLLFVLRLSSRILPAEDPCNGTHAEPTGVLLQYYCYECAIRVCIRRRMYHRKSYDCCASSFCFILFLLRRFNNATTPHDGEGSAIVVRLECFRRIVDSNDVSRPI